MKFKAYNENSKARFKKRDLAKMCALHLAEWEGDPVVRTEHQRIISRCDVTMNIMPLNQHHYDEFQESNHNPTI